MIPPDARLLVWERRKECRESQALAADRRSVVGLELRGLFYFGNYICFQGVP
jgi:hypothetical protein